MRDHEESKPAEPQDSGICYVRYGFGYGYSPPAGEISVPGVSGGIPANAVVAAGVLVTAGGETVVAS